MAQRRFEKVASKAKQAVGMENPPAHEAEGPIRTVREALRSFGDGDWDGFTKALGDEVEWRAPGSGNFPGGGSLTGRDQVKEKFISAIDRTYATFGFVPESFLDADDDVVVFGNFECEGRKGTNRVDEPGVMVWKLDGDEAEEVRIYTDSAAFPEVMSEDDERELEAEVKEQEEEQESDGTGDEEPRSEKKEEAQA